MTAQCPLHAVEMEEKNGQYGIYYSHIVENQGYCNGKKITPFKGPQAPAKPAMPVDKVEDFKKELGRSESTWSDEEKSKQITRLTLAKSFIQANSDFDNAVVNMDLEKWVNWIFSGKIPADVNKLKPNKEQDEMYEAFDKSKEEDD